MSVYLHSFRTLKPRYHRNQSELVRWTLDSHERAERLTKVLPDAEKFKRVLGRFCLREEQIQTRYFECDDVDENWETHEIYHLTRETPAGADLYQKNLFFQTRALEIFSQLYADNPTPSQLIHVTCTGYVSPSAPQVYFSEKENRPEITHAYHMGCYASLPAIRLARSLCQEGSVDIVHTEMCSLHLDPLSHTPEQMVVQTLFADGHCRYRVDQDRKGFEVLKVLEKIVPHSAEDMTWIPSSLGMRMSLSREVPQKIGEALPRFLAELAEKSDIPVEVLKREAIFAIHPGGPKIIDTVKELLELSEAQVRASQLVLFTRGNMSSATLPHVWEHILNEGHSGRLVVSLAFGPGLTVFGALFRVVA